jgi:hypothetical protein
MPETRIERGLFVLGLLAIAALGFLVVHLWHHRQAAVAAAQPTSVSGSPRTSRVASTTRATRPATTSRRTESTKPKTTRVAKTTPEPSAGTVALRVTARSSTWLEVRSNSATGTVLYAGTLTTGSSKAFRARALWARFGAAGNLSARLDGKTFPLPSGTYDAAFDRHGFRRVGT